MVTVMENSDINENGNGTNSSCVLSSYERHCASTNSTVIDRSVSLDDVKKVAAMYWTKAYNIVKTNSNKVSYETLCKTFRFRTPELNGIQVNIQPMMLEPTKSPLQDPSIYDNIRSVSIDSAPLLLNNDIYHTSPPRHLLLEDRPSLDAVAKENPIVGDVVATVNERMTSVNSVVQNDDLCSPSLDVPAQPSSTQIVDPTPLLLIQRRLQSVTTLAAMDMTEDICIRSACQSVRGGYKQLDESMREVKRLVYMLPLSLSLNSSTIGTNISNVVEEPYERNELVESAQNTTASTITTPQKEFVDCNKSRLVKDLYDDLTQQHVALGFCLDPLPKHYIYDSYPDIDVSLLSDERNAYADHDFPLPSPGLRDQRKSIRPSPTSMSYTYRSEDSFNKETYNTTTPSDRGEQMPFVFTSPTSMRNSRNEETRSLLSQNTLLSRRPYMYRRTRRFLPCILTRLVCVR